MSGIRTIRKLKSWLESEDNSTKIGWYSEKQRNCSYTLRYSQGNDKAHTCANVYLTPEGKEVIITEVTDGLVLNSKWDDVKMIGPVTKWVRGIYNMHVTFSNYDNANYFDDFKVDYNDLKFDLSNIDCTKEDFKEKQLERMFPSYKDWKHIINDKKTKI